MEYLNKDKLLDRDNTEFTINASRSNMNLTISITVQ